MAGCNNIRISLATGYGSKISSFENVGFYGKRESGLGSGAMNENIPITNLVYHIFPLALANLGTLTIVKATMKNSATTYSGN